MLNLNHGKRLLRRFKKNEDGNMAVTFALSAVAVIGTMGAAMDYSVLSNAAARGQAIADQTALSAAIFVKNNDRPPANFEEGVTQGEHSAHALGYEFKGWVDGGSNNVEVNVVYDDNAKEARVTVSGQTVPTFIQLLGQQSLKFSSEAVVSYLDIDEKHPASIALVLDNSGSMGWDDKFANPNGTSPLDAHPRIDGLEFSVKKFNADLSDRLGTEDIDGLRTIRMGMLPYSSNIVTENKVEMNFGYIDDEDVEDMFPDGNTNSNPPMAEAKIWMDGENQEHRDEADRVGEAYREPLKFIIFMSDGQNTLGAWEFEPNDTAPVYWKQNNNGSWSGIWAHSYNNQFGYTRGHLRRQTDSLTIETCQNLKALGTEIFTIGYALEVGNYNANNPWNQFQTAHVNLWNQTNAYNLLQSCATKEENFVRAGDNEELEAAFDTIQNAIVKELIRIKS